MTHTWFPFPLISNCIYCMCPLFTIVWLVIDPISFGLWVPVICYFGFRAACIVHLLLRVSSVYGCAFVMMGVEQRNFFYLTELENWTISMFWRMWKRSVENPATTGSFSFMIVTSGKTIQPHYHNSVYTGASILRHVSNYCIKLMSKDETICEIM